MSLPRSRCVSRKKCILDRGAALTSKAPDYQTDFTNWAYQFNGIVNNWARSITAWNIALDEKRQSKRRTVPVRWPDYD